MKTFKTLVSVFALSALFATSSCTQQQNQKEMDNHSNVFMYENDMEWEPAGEGVTRQIVGYNEDIMMVKVKFEKGGVGTAHTHAHCQDRGWGCI